MLTSASTASTRGTGGSLLTSTSSGAAGLTRSVLGKRGVGDAELDDGGEFILSGRNDRTAIGSERCCGVHPREPLWDGASVG